MAHTQQADDNRARIADGVVDHAHNHPPVVWSNLTVNQVFKCGTLLTFQTSIRALYHQT